jgi:hypothetical protein
MIAPDRARRRAGAALGSLLLLAWAGWWLASLHADRLLGGRRTWLPVMPYLGNDFLASYHSCRLWLSGRDPYREVNAAPVPHTYAYPPVCLWLFAWSNAFPARAATSLWLLALTALAGTGARVLARTRSALGLPSLPLPLALALVLGSTPVLFALERGNCDLLVLGLLLAAAGLLNRPGHARQAAAGALLALAAWVKVYPAVLLPGLLALRRRRAAGWFGLTAVLLALADWPGTLAFLGNARAVVADYTAHDLQNLEFSHGLTSCWKVMWTGTALARLGRVPAPVAGPLLLGPLIGWVSLGVCRRGCPPVLLGPYLLWLAAAGCFLMPLSYDYKLFYLPLLALGLWDRRDPVAVHVLLGFFLLWWQPLHLPIGAPLLLAFKVGALGALGAALVRRARERRAGLPAAAPAPVLRRAA